MISALCYWQACSFRNRLVTRLKRLKQPKYLVGAIVGGAYFYFYFFRFMFAGATGRHGGPPVSLSADPALATDIGALALFAVVLAAWLFPRERAALNFSEAEIAFLFPAPISRRGLIHYKLLRSGSQNDDPLHHHPADAVHWAVAGGGRFVLDFAARLLGDFGHAESAFPGRFVRADLAAG